MNLNGYQYCAFATPVASWNTALETSSAIDSRSIACAGLVTGGQANSRGITDHSLASRNGIAISPTFVCRPWLSANSQLGEVGQSKSSGRSRSAGTIAFPGRFGM